MTTRIDTTFQVSLFCRVLGIIALLVCFAFANQATASLTQTHENPVKDFSIHYPESWGIHNEINYTTGDHEVCTTSLETQKLKCAYSFEIITPPGTDIASPEADVDWNYLGFYTYEGRPATDQDKEKMKQTIFAVPDDEASDMPFSVVVAGSETGFRAWKAVNGVSFVFGGYILPDDQSYSVTIMGLISDIGQANVQEIQDIIQSFSIINKAAEVQEVDPAPQAEESPQEPENQTRLIRVQGQQKVYAVENNIYHWIPNEEIFKHYNYDWRAIEVVDEGALDGYERARLLKIEGKPEVWYVTESGMKRHIPSAEIFNSYRNDWNKITKVSEIELEFYPTNNLIRLEGGVEVYLLENGIKRWIESPEAFARHGFDWHKIAPVNQTELNYYPLSI